jgi:hypothetical protein
MRLQWSVERDACLIFSFREPFFKKKTSSLSLACGVFYMCICCYRCAAQFWFLTCGGTAHGRGMLRPIRKQVL